jgi:hypothetical protein
MPVRLDLFDEQNFLAVGIDAIRRGMNLGLGNVVGHVVAPVGCIPYPPNANTPYTSVATMLA